MKLQLIRNATMRIEMAGTTLLTDPMLSDVGAIESWAGIAPNPTTPLPMTMAEIMANIDAVLASHVHQDHFDKIAYETLPKTLPVYCQPVDVERFREEGFKTINPVQEQMPLNQIRITRTEGQHGSGDILNELGEVSGFVLEANHEPTVYWVGDSIWCQPVKQIVARVRPDIIIVHASGAKLPGSDVIIMDDDMVIALCNHAPQATVVAVHMEALDHCFITREQLRQTAHKNGISNRQLLIPADGESLHFDG